MTPTMVFNNEGGATMYFRAKALATWGLVSLLSVAGDFRLADAAQKGDVETVRSLLKQHSDVNARQADGATALSWAAYRDELEIADILIGAGANSKLANDYG